ncbi:MAG TPA: head GIN domain-containing protein [Anaerolineales bacterium]|nr:head GIN domain-containing protein [Anaerolineales bacterium]
MYKMRGLSVALLLVTMLTVTACSGIVTGSGDVISETRQVSNYDRIVLSGSGEVIVTQGGSESLSIETDDNIMRYVEVEVENGALKLGFKRGVNIMSHTRLVFYVGVDDLNSLTISGSGDIEADMLETDRLEVTINGSGDVQIDDLSASEVRAMISGSGEIDLAGNVVDQDVTISGSGKYRAGDMCSALVEVNVSGSGDATVCAMERLDANISGSGSINYYGRPTINSFGGGSGDLNSLGEK